MKTPFNHLEEHVDTIRLTSAERSAMRARLLEEMALSPMQMVPSPYTRFFEIFAYAQRPILAALLILVLLGGGTAFAAERALPGDAFYGVKVSVLEPAVGSLQTSAAAQADWQVHLASTRLSEAQAVAASTRVGDLYQGRACRAHGRRLAASC